RRARAGGAVRRRAADRDRGVRRGARGTHRAAGLSRPRPPHAGRRDGRRLTLGWSRLVNASRRVLFVIAALAAALAPRAEASGDPIRVYYDGGDCGTDAIEVQAYDRASRAWRPHALHPRVSVPSCQTEDAGQLWNELRWRCVPAPGDREEPAWRVFPVFDAEV